MRFFKHINLPLLFRTFGVLSIFFTLYGLYALSLAILAGKLSGGKKGNAALSDAFIQIFSVMDVFVDFSFLLGFLYVLFFVFRIRKLHRIDWFLFPLVLLALYFRYGQVSGILEFLLPVM